MFRMLFAEINTLQEEIKCRAHTTQFAYNCPNDKEQA
jgi:hypothetical protein